MLPVIIEDLIKKVTDQSTHPEKRQHFATTLRKIVDEASKALNQFDKDWINK